MDHAAEPKAGTAWRVIPQSHPAWLVASLSMGLLSLADAVAASGPTPPRTLLAALCVGVSGGALLGVVATLLFELLARAPAWCRLLAWSLSGSALGVWLSEALAARANLGGTYDKLARNVIIGSIGLAIGVALLGMMVQPTKRKPKGWFGSLPGLGRGTIALVSSCAAIALSCIDRSGRTVEYPAVTWLLRWLGLFFTVLAGMILLDWARKRAPALIRYLYKGVPWASLAALGIALLVVGGLDASRLLSRPLSAAPLTVLRLMTDFDGDGQSSFFGGGDCNAFDGRIGPLRRELANNGVDENCRGGDGVTTAALVKTVGHALQAQAPSADDAGGLEPPFVKGVVYITVDTVGAASLHAYGYPRQTTPRLALWANKSVIFDEAYTCGASTSLALGGTFRGVYPRRLIWRRMAKGAGPMRPLEPGQRLNARERLYRLPFEDPHPTLPELIRAGGIRSLAVSAVHFAGADTGVVGSFDLQRTFTRSNQEPDDQGATNQALAWLAELKPDERYFLWIHYLGPHTPSTLTAGVPRYGNTTRDLYDHEISTFDARVQPLLDELSARQDRGESLAIIFSADHGEEFLDHRFHGHTVSDRVSHIPFMISAPGIAPRRTSTLASSVDVFSTVLSLLGLPAPNNVDSRDLVPVLRGAVADWSRVVFTDGWVVDALDRLQSNQVAAIDGRQRLRFDFTNMAEELLNLERERAGARQENMLGLSDAAPLRGALNVYLEDAAVDPRTD